MYFIVLSIYLLLYSIFNVKELFVFSITSKLISNLDVFVLSSNISQFFPPNFIFGSPFSWKVYKIFKNDGIYSSSFKSMIRSSYV